MLPPPWGSDGANALLDHLCLQYSVGSDICQYLMADHKDTPMTAEEILKLEQDVVMVDLTDYRGNAYQLIDQACQHNRPDTIYSIISPAPSIQPSTDNWWHSIVPRQSHVMKQGIQVPVQKDRLVFSYLHAGSCRRDHVERYDPLEIIQYGSQHTILAWHFMAELEQCEQCLLGLPYCWALPYWKTGEPTGQLSV